LLPPRGGSAVFRAANVYDRARILIDTFSSLRIHAYAVEGFVLSTSRFSPHVVVASYSVHQRAEADAGLQEIIAWSVTLLGSDIQSYPCFSSRQGPITYIPQEPLSLQLPGVWRKAQDALFC
jgi:hypothetical protein